MKRPGIAFLIISALCLVLAGCAKKHVEKEESEAPEIQKEFHKGGAPITVRVTISRKSITIADLITVVVDAEYEKGVKVGMPELSDIDLGGFLVRNYKVMPESVGEDGKLETSSELVLEPQLSGEYIIQPFKVGFALKDERVNEQAEEYPHYVETEPFKIEVESLTEGDPRTAELKPIQGPVELPREKMDWRKMTFIVSAIAGGLLLIAVIVFFGRKWRPKKIVKFVPAHVRAFEALRKLREKQLLEKGLIKEFYYEISDIMRHYIEDRFQLAAPEQTTEEFLYTMSTDGSFDPKTRDLLKSFMEHCDLVKYARHAPETDEIQRTFNITRDFIDTTKQVKANGI